MSSQTTTRGAETRVDRLLSVVERAGNRLPDPFILFVLLFLAVALVSTVMSWADVQVQLPGADEVTDVRGLFTSEGLVWLTTSLGANFIDFPPLVTVLTILLGVALAEHSGLLAAGIRRLFGSAPSWALPYAVGFVGVSGSVMADSSFVVIPPLAAMVFKAAGRHPVAGLLGGFAAVGAGYSTSVFVTSLDALFAGITNAVTAGLPDPGAPVNPLSNYYFNVVSAVVLSLIAGWIIARVLEPRLLRMDVPTEQVEDEESAPAETLGGGVALDATERSALRWALLAGFLTAAVMVAAVALPGSPWRNEDGGFLPESPLLDSIVFIVFVMFAVPGIVYGFRAGTFTQASDVPRVMGAMIKSMSGFIVLAFILGQFTALFDWSGVGVWLAVSGADAVDAIGLPAFAAILCFVAAGVVPEPVHRVGVGDVDPDGGGVRADVRAAGDRAGVRAGGVPGR